jgi:hypothetical protein
MKQVNHYSQIAACLLAAGCASPVSTRLFSSGIGLSPTTNFAILESEPDAAPVDAALDSLIKTNLTAHGYTLAKDSDYILSTAFSMRPGHIAIFGTPTAAPLSTTQKKSGLGQCNAQVHRLTISVLERATGKPIYQGAAEETHCNAVATNSLPHLVESLTADILKPGGNRVVTRKKSR